MSFKLKNVVSYDSGDDEEDCSNDLGLPLEKLNLGPRKKLIVLCLGGLLVERRRLHNGLPYPAAGTVGTGRRVPDIVCGNFLIYKRPFSDEFLKFCFQRFEVGIWSSAMERNMEAVLRTLTSDVPGRFAFVWDQNQCRDSGYKSLAKKDKPIFLKELKKIWNNEGQVLSWPKGTYSSSNTLLIDTEPSKALLNPPNTAIFPHEYKVNQSEDAFLGQKGQLQSFLNGLEGADDVPSYVKEHALGQPAITPMHPSWNYYERIISRFRNAQD